LPSTVLFDYPNLRTLVRYLATEIMNQASASESLSIQPVTQIGNENSLDILNAIEQMSDDEVESWFN